MNGSNPIFPLASIGQTVSVQNVQTSESENTVFAENLTAALAATSIAPVPSNQQEAETSIASLDGGLVAGSPDAAISSADETALAGDGRTAGVSKSLGKVDIGAIAGSAMPSEGGSSAEDLRTDDFVNVFGRSVTASGSGRFSVESEGAGQEPSTVTVTDAASLPAARHAGSTSFDATASQPIGNMVAGQQVTGTDGGPGVDAALDSKARQPMIASARHETTPIHQPSELPVHVLGESAPGAVLNDVPSSQAPLADQPLDEDHRSTVPTPTLAREDKFGTKPSAPSLADLQSVTHRTPASAEQPLLLRRTVDAPAGTSLQQEMSSLLANDPESALTGARSQVGRQTSEAIDPFIRSLTPTANPSGLSDERPATKKRGTTPGILNEAIGKSGPSVLPGGTPQISIAEGSLRPSGEFSGFDRLQPVLQTEGVTLDTARFEASSSFSQLRGQTPAAHAPAGAQIALQIVRSLPEGIERFSLHLKPAELGSVDIQLNFEGGGRLSALIMAERPETLELLQRDSRILERSLGDSGLKLSSDGLSFALKQDQQQQQQGQSFHEQAHAREAASRAGRAYDGASDAEPSPPTQRIDRLRLLDIRT